MCKKGYKQTEKHIGKRITKESIKKRIETVVKNKVYRGKNNISYKKGSGMKGKKHLKETKEKISKNRVYLRGKENPLYGRTLSEEQKNKISKSRKGKNKGKTTWNKGITPSTKTREKQSESMKKSWMSGKRKREKKFVSSWEKKFYDILIKHYQPYYKIKRQFYLKGLNHPFDFAIPDVKILIEIDGIYFHNLYGGKERDAEINEFVWRTYPDWSLFRFDDNDLKNMGLI